LSSHYTGVLQTTKAKGMNPSIDERSGELVVCLRLFAANRLQIPVQQAVVNEIFKISGTTSIARAFPNNNHPSARKSGRVEGQNKIGVRKNGWPHVKLNYNHKQITGKQ
jgi:hypothetical protein